MFFNMVSLFDLRPEGARLASHAGLLLMLEEGGNDDDDDEEGQLTPSQRGNHREDHVVNHNL